MENRAHLVAIGKVVGTHGVKGTLKIFPFVESLSYFSTGDHVRVEKEDGKLEDFKISCSKPHQNVILVAFNGVNSMEKCQKLVGAELFIERERLPETEEGSYYWVDLIGLAVYTTEGGYLGQLENIFSTGSNDVYVVKDKASEKLIPALEAVVKAVDLDNKVMRVELPEGL